MYRIYIYTHTPNVQGFWPVTLESLEMYSTTTCIEYIYIHTHQIFRDFGWSLFESLENYSRTIYIYIYICIHTHQMFRDFGWSLFESLEKYSKLPGAGGYTAIADVTVETENKEGSTHNRLDRMDSFLLSETFKYLYCKSMYACIHTYMNA
jgi:hypothetical protein